MNAGVAFVLRNRFAFLLAALLAFFLLLPLADHLRDVRAAERPLLLETGPFGVVLVAVMVSVSTTRTGKILALALGLPAVVVRLLPYSHTPAGDVVWTLFAMGFLGYATASLLRHSLKGRHVDRERLLAGLCAYALLAITWALIYSLVAEFRPGAFRVAEGTSPEMRVTHGGTVTALYFSICSMTTLGLGDVVPVTSGSRMLVAVEAMLGQLYLAVVVARLIGLHIADRPD